jgi:lipopolysaccharide/colanic/teichoic acid biosynthesis glycosyltransferase
MEQNLSIYTKDITDRVLALLALLVLSPILLGTAIAIKLDSRGPIFFPQVRIGRGGKPFTMLKFRTLPEGTPAVTQKELRDSGRLTSSSRLGQFLRRSSINELPQLFNVLAGHMSLVGPRPVAEFDTAGVSPRIRLGVLSFKPGITGWAQVTGRGDLSDREYLEADVWYCQNWSYALDLHILYRTIPAVLTARGAY